MISKWKEKLNKIQCMLDQDLPLKYIGAEFNVSKQRIDQIIRKYSLISRSKKQNTQMLYSTMEEYWLFDIVRRKVKQTNLRIKIFKELKNLPKTCPVLGIDINYMNSGARQDNSPSIDRINNDLGYLPGNCLIVSWRANRLKNDGNPEEHYKIWEYYKALDKNIQ